MITQAEFISEHLCKAVRDGLFNDIWYYIKDFKNYKILFILEFYDEGGRTEFVGELNHDGFKDMNGEFYSIRFENPVSYYYGNIPPKFSVGDIEKEHIFLENKNNDLDNSNYVNTHVGNTKYIEDLPDDFKLWEAYDMKLDPILEHTKETVFPLTLKIDFLYKVEEAITYYLFEKVETRKYLWDLMSNLNNSDDVDFDSQLNFTSMITDEKDNVILNDFLLLDFDGYISQVKPMSNDTILEFYQILDYPIKLSAQLPNVPKIILDELNNIENKEAISSPDYQIIFREYHKLIEILANKIYQDHYELIQRSISLIQDENYKRILGIKDMDHYKSKYNITSLNSFAKMLNFLTAPEVNYFDEKDKDVVEKEIIFRLETYSGFSKMRNNLTHKYSISERSILISGIAALKVIIRIVFKLFYDTSRKKDSL